MRRSWRSTGEPARSSGPQGVSTPSVDEYGSPVEQVRSRSGTVGSRSRMRLGLSSASTRRGRSWEVDFSRTGECVTRLYADTAKVG
jgi:hypothetical protein